MYHHQYQLVDVPARRAIRLSEYQAEIRRAFRYIRFIATDLNIRDDLFEFATLEQLSPGDRRHMGHHVARSATELARAAARIYEAVPESNRLKSTQLFKRIKP